MNKQARVRDSFKGMSGKTLKKRLTKGNKTAQLNFRTTREDRESINRAADRLSMSTSDYLVALHQIALERLPKR